MFNEKQQLLVFNSILKSIDNEEIEKMLKLYIKQSLRGIGTLDRQRIVKNSQTVEEPFKLLFIFIVLNKKLRGTLEQIANQVKFEIEKEDIEKAQETLNQLGFSIGLSHKDEVFRDYLKS